jgi:LCP family protein required for cell wall assembly
VKRFLLVLLIGAVLVVFGAFAYLKWLEGRIDHIPAEELVSLEPTVSSIPRTFLIVGTDSRENLPDDFEDFFGEFSGSRSDVIMLVHFVPGAGAQLLSIPRDLKTDIPGWETNRINAAFARGGPELLVQTIKRELDISINHYIEIGFGGFAQLVDAVGGVTLDFDYPARDRKSGLDVGAGLQHLDAEMALAYVRSRFYQEFRDGEWVSVSGADISRTRRQQRLLLALFDHVTSRAGAFDLPSFVSTLTDQITADEGLTAGLLLELGRNAMALRSGQLETATLPVRYSNEERAYVIPIEPNAAVLLDAFRNGRAYPES